MITTIHSFTRMRPILTGLFTVLATVIIGMSIAFAAGLTTPAQVFAEVLPPCCGGGVILPPPPPPPPVIVSPIVPVVPQCTLSASPTSFPEGGGSTTLAWTTSAASSATIDQGVGSVAVPDGTTDVSVTTTTTYTMTVLAAGGGTAECSTTVTVTPPPAPTCTLTASPTSIVSGDSSELAWTTTNASSFVIDHTIGSVTPVDVGSTTVSPTVTTTYTGTATSASGKVAHCSATVTVTTTPVPSCTLTASPTAIQTGDSSTLSWTTTNAVSFSIDHMIGSVTPVDAGSTTVSPNQTSTYTGTATSASGKVAHCTATVTVTTTPPVPSCTLTASPDSITAGSSSMLAWTTTNADTFSIDQGIGSVTPVSSGAQSVSPTVTTTYTGTATGASGTAHCTATVTVTTTPPGSPSCTLSAAPSQVNSGDHATLTWTTTNADTFSIDQGIGSVTPATGGSVSSKAITSNTTFTGTAVSPTGKVATCTAVVTVGGGGGGGGPSCTMTVSPSSIRSGNSATLTWGGSEITNVDIDNGIATATSSPGHTSVAPGAVGSYTYVGTFHAQNGQTLTCSATLTVEGGSGGCTSNCGGGGSTSPTIVLSALPHVVTQPLAYLYLSQIPYTGIDLGPVGTAVYWILLIGLSILLTYLVLFMVAPFVNRTLRQFGARVSEALNAPKPAPVTEAPMPQRASEHLVASAVAEAPRGYSSYDGFKSFAHGEALSIDDIVKGLSREHAVRSAEKTITPVPAAVEELPEPEPIKTFEEILVEPEAPVAAPEAASIPADIRGFGIALLQGDREAVFAGLRQHTRGGGVPEHLVSAVACLVDDVYRARVEGTACDVTLARVAARFDTPTLEKLVASLTTAIDSSYSSGVTGAKLALTRALTAIGA